jgi:ADP-heptose:LPS heptosyltransferase
MELSKKSTVWIARCDHLGDLIITLPIIDQISEKYTVKVVVEKYIFDFAKHFIKTVEIVLSEDFLIISSFPETDIFVPFSMSKAIRKHTKKCFHGLRLGYIFRSKDWFYANRLSTVYRANKATHEAELLRQFAQSGLEFLRPLKALDFRTDWLLKFGFDKSLFQSMQTNKKKQIIFHPGSNQNGREWPAQMWAELIEHCHSSGYDVFVTGRSQEAKRFLPALSKVSGKFINCIDQDKDMIALAHRILSADLVVSSGTGPAHLAASMGVAVITLYPPIKTAGKLRWHPIGSQVNCLASPRYEDGSFCKNFRSCDSSSCACMSDIKPEHVLSVMDQIFKV